MKILALMTFEIFSHSLGSALKSLGHEVCGLGEFDEQKLEDTIHQFQPDMVWDMGWDVWHLRYSTEGRLPFVKEILNRNRIFHVYFAEEDWLHFERWSKVYCRETAPDFVLTRSPECVPKYKELGFKAAFFDVGCDPGFHKKYPPNPAYECDVAVVVNGQYYWGEIRYKSIDDLVIPLFDQEFNTKIWGRHWEAVDTCYPGKRAKPEMLQGILPFKETPHVYSSAKINISVQTCRDQLSNRTYDILSSGGFLLTSNTEAVRERLIPAVHCEVSSSSSETVEKIRYYLQNEQKRREIAEAGHNYAIRNFSYQKTLEDIWPKIEREYKSFLEKSGKVASTCISIENISFSNKISNGNFHAGNLQPWMELNMKVNPSIVYNGSNSAEFASGATNSYIQQYVTVEPGENYEFIASFTKLGQGEPTTVSVMIQYFTEEYSFVTTGLYSTMYCDVSYRDENTGEEGNWITLKAVTINTPLNVTRALILINRVPAEGSPAVLVSDCLFRETEV